MALRYRDDKDVSDYLLVSRFSCSTSRYYDIRKECLEVDTRI